MEALAVKLTQREGELIQEKFEVKKLANFLKQVIGWNFENAYRFFSLMFLVKGSVNDLLPVNMLNLYYNSSY